MYHVSIEASLCRQFEHSIFPNTIQMSFPVRTGIFAKFTRMVAAMIDKYIISTIIWHIANWNGNV